MNFSRGFIDESQTWNLHGVPFLRKNNEEALPLLNEWGIPYAEVFLTSFSEYNPRFANALAAGKGEVRVHSVHVLNTQFEPQLYAQHPRVQTDAYDWLKKAMLSAKNLGARHYTFHGIARLKRTFRENLPATAAETAKIFSVCKEYGVRLCYENVEWALYNRPGIFTQLKKNARGSAAYWISNRRVSRATTGGIILPKWGRTLLPYTSVT